MKFKTTIEIISEAEDKSEAREIAGDYLSGDLTSGVEMRCATRPLCNYKKSAISVTIISVAVIFGLIAAINIKHSQNTIRNISGLSAIQPPLKTSDAENKELKFKKEWQDRQTRSALDYIKK